jgi:hypothetical protein
VNAPSPRFHSGAIYDPVRDRMVVFGGYYYDGTPHFLNDVWALSLDGTSAWTHLTPTGAPPVGRELHSAIYDPVRDRMVVFGGYENSGSDVNEVWALSLAGTPAWTELAPTGTPPSARESHSSIYDPVRDRMVVFGGNHYDGSDHYLNEVWALSLAGAPAWTELAPSGAPPSARAGHGAIYDPVSDGMFVFGGYDGSAPNFAYRNDVWFLGWSATVAVGDPDLQSPATFLRPPAPNPSANTTAVSYSLAIAGRVRLGVYDASGRQVRELVNREQRAGAETVVWDGTRESGSRVGAGLYFIRLAGPGISTTRKVILLR